MQSNSHWAPRPPDAMSTPAVTVYIIYSENLEMTECLEIRSERRRYSCLLRRQTIRNLPVPWTTPTVHDQEIVGIFYFLP